MSFKVNSSQQISFNVSVFPLTAREKKALDNSWAKIFADEIFPNIDEETKYTKEAGSLCRGRGFLLVNFMTALSDIQPCFSPWVRTPKPLTSISSSTGIVRYLRPSITRVSSR